jgi:hypothetical protein
MRGSRSSIPIEDIAHAEGVDPLMFAPPWGRCPLSALVVSGQAFCCRGSRRGARLKKTHVDHDKPIVHTSEFLKHKERLDFSKMVAPGSGAVPNCRGSRRGGSLKRLMSTRNKRIVGTLEFFKRKG